MPKAFLCLRTPPKSRLEAFRSGLKACGFEVVEAFPTRHDPCDVFVTWNRIGYADQVARRFTGQVLVAENAAWGNDFHGKRWLSVARNWHNTIGCFPKGDNARWDSLGVELAPFRQTSETVVLPQRGIGPKEVAMPRGWTAPGRVRPHPGRNPSIPLRTDLANCAKVVTWGSGAAVQALMWGIKVESHYPNWIARQQNTDQSRLDMFRLLALAQWEENEITRGEPFARLLGNN